MTIRDGDWWDIWPALAGITIVAFAVGLRQPLGAVPTMVGVTLALEGAALGKGLWAQGYVFLMAMCATVVLFGGFIDDPIGESDVGERSVSAVLPNAIGMKRSIFTSLGMTMVALDMVLISTIGNRHREIWCAIALVIVGLAVRNVITIGPGRTAQSQSWVHYIAIALLVVGGITLMVSPTIIGLFVFVLGFTINEDGLRA